jgi:hypothetical protein
MDERLIVKELKRMVEILIELSETELDAVAGGVGSATFSFSNSASGTTATVTGTLTQSTTASSARQSGTFTSLST